METQVQTDTSSMIALPPERIEALSDLAGSLSFRPNFILWALVDAINNGAQIIFVETGNQAGKTATIAYQFHLSMLGIHPSERMNMRPSNPVRVYRFASESLPLETTDQGEVKNTVYPALKKFLPASLIEKDVTVRKPSMAIKDIQGGPNILVEFVSYGQSIQTQAGQQRFAIFLDEESPRSFYEEQIPRLIAAQESGRGGLLIMGLTPTQGISWTFEGIYNKAGIIYNSPNILEFLNKKTGFNHNRIEYTGADKDIVVIRAATDDNPTFSKATIDRNVSKYDDQATMENRRYGIYHQVSGVIFQEYEATIHCIDSGKYFPKGVPHNWYHARGIDFHEHTNWACGWIALSEMNEAFIYKEFNPSPDSNVTLVISKEVATMSGDYNYDLNLIDARAAIKQANTGDAPIDDLNRYFREYKKEGLCSGGWWQTWDSKNLIGRDKIKERLRNSKIVGKPFNNKVVTRGVISYLPTLWILDSCPTTSYMFKNWRWEQWANRDSLVTKEEKNKPEDKNSHFPILYECILKDIRFRVKRESYSIPRNPYEGYMRGRG